MCFLYFDHYFMRFILSLKDPLYFTVHYFHISIDEDERLAMTQELGE